MTDKPPYKDRAPVEVSAAAIAEFIGLLRQERVYDDFLKAAPPLPADIAGHIEEAMADAKASTEAVPKRLLTVQPELMNYARDFTRTRGLAGKSNLAANFAQGRCRGGVDCPPGQ